MRLHKHTRCQISFFYGSVHILVQNTLGCIPFYPDKADIRLLIFYIKILQNSLSGLHLQVVTSSHAPVFTVVHQYNNNNTY